MDPIERGVARATDRQLTTPAVAPTDSQKPTDQTSSGSTTTSPMTASDSTRSECWGRPRTYANAVMAAITAARSIDGSNRVSTTNQAMSKQVSAHLHHGVSARSSGPAAARRNATFCPDTAVRCDSPLRRNRSIIAGG